MAVQVADTRTVEVDAGIIFSNIILMIVVMHADVALVLKVNKDCCG